MIDMNTILKQYFGFDSFRPGQEEIIRSVLEGRDTLAIMRTSGGKSLCYQVPALAKDGICLVISPLIALMKDQVQNLRKRNITAYAIYSGMSRRELIVTLKTVINSNCKFLYVSPERLETNLFKEYLPGMNINLVAVDEAHCISQWGYDFRPPYLRIAALRKELPGVPVLALTASATKEVQKDICEKLNPAFPNQSKVAWQIFRQSFERSNLSYTVFKVDSKINKITEILTKVDGSGIIYCKSRKRTKEISDLLRLQNISSNYYHAGLNQEERHRRQEEWIDNKVRIIVCTNAFGMGIDKPNVRTVIHVDIPDCVESYYQEAGRAGRDGKTSFAILLYDETDIRDLEELPSLRFPSESDLRKVYQAVANYLQLPAGTGEGEYFDFDLADFMKKFKLTSPATLYALKALEQEGWLSFNEQVFIPSTVVFTTDKHRLYEFEKSHSSLDPVIKALLRAYEGIFDQPTSISENVLSGLLKAEPNDIKKSLTELHSYGIIEYKPMKDNPQLFLYRQRIKAEDISIDHLSYLQRKRKFQARITEMIRYVRMEMNCRSRHIAAYLGDESVKPCGICDNCFRQKAIQLSREEFEAINHRILNTVKYESLHAQELLLKLSDIKKEKAWKVIEFLQAENKIDLDKNGWVRMK